MAIRRKINKESFDKLSKELQAEYIERDGKYVLDLDSEREDDVGPLQRAKDRAVQERKKAEQRARKAEQKLAELDDSDARKRGDIKKLEASWKDKNKKLSDDFKFKLASKDKFISTTLVDSVASAMAAKISTSPAIILPHIKARLKADLSGDTPTTRVLDKEGNVSSLTVAELEKEFVDNKDFSSIILANKAKGGGALSNDQSRSGPALREFSDGKQRMLSEISGKDLATILRAKKEQANLE